MPWKETDKMEQKELFIKAMLANEKPFKHLCADFGISEKRVTSGRIVFTSREKPDCMNSHAPD